MVEIDSKPELNDAKWGILSYLSDEEEASVPKVVENYYFTDEHDEFISFSTLSCYYDGKKVLPSKKPQLFLHGAADSGLQQIYRPVVAWKLSILDLKPVISVRVREGAWIKLQKPRKCYEEIIRSVLITSHILYYARNHPNASGKSLWDHLCKVFSIFVEKPTESDIQEHISLIDEIQKRDQMLKRSEVLRSILEKRPKKRIPTHEECDNLSKAKKAKSIVKYDEFEEDMDDDIADSEEEEDEDELYDGVCAICDNGGQMLCCEGPCLRSFHPLKKAGAESKCTSLGMTEAQVEAIEYFFCLNCKYKQQQCFICGELGCSNKMRDTEVYSCVSATCGRFYHPKCVSRMLDSGSKVGVLEKSIAKGEQFLCPIHRCAICKQTENKKVKELQFAICRRCPKSYHRKCLPKSIPFEDKNDDEPQRAWEGLIPKRILIYCRKHKIDPKLQTPKWNHIVFPEVPAFNNDLERNRIAYAWGVDP